MTVKTPEAFRARAALLQKRDPVRNSNIIKKLLRKARNLEAQKV